MAVFTFESHLQTKFEMAPNGHDECTVPNTYGITHVEKCKYFLWLIFHEQNINSEYWFQLPFIHFIVCWTWKHNILLLAIKKNVIWRRPVRKSLWTFSNFFDKKTIEICVNNMRMATILCNISLFDASTCLSVFQNRNWGNIRHYYVITVCWKTDGTIHQEHHNLRHYGNNA